MARPLFFDHGTFFNVYRTNIIMRVFLDAAGTSNDNCDLEGGSASRGVYFASMSVGEFGFPHKLDTRTYNNMRGFLRRSE